MSLRLVPVTRAAARGFVAMHHRHHGPPPGAVFQVGVADGQDRGVDGIPRTLWEAAS